LASHSKRQHDTGPTAVLTYGNTTVVVMSRSVSLFDRAMYYAVGINPRDYDLIVVKSPHTEYHMYDEWVEKNFASSKESVGYVRLR
jgi:microcystin degradation protein MlrC